MATTGSGIVEQLEGCKATDLTEFVLKVSSRCNIDCSYCYMYKFGDGEYLRQPKIMSAQTARLFASRLSEHVVEHQIEKVVLGLHGGEPLLLGPERLGTLLQIVKEHVQGTKLTFKLQTNATLMNSEWIDLFEAHNVVVGVSIDGNEYWHDKSRPDFQGRGTFKSTLAGLKLIQEAAPPWKIAIWRRNKRNQP